MAPAIPPITSTHSVVAGQLPRSWLRLRDWLLADPRSQPDDIRNELLHQRSRKTKTLVIAVLGSLLIASIAAGLTGARWAYAWVLAEMVLGSVRMSLMMNALAKSKTGQRNGTTIAPVWAGLTSVILISAGCYQCVESGNLPLIMMAGVGLANLIGGIASRNAGTPRYGILLICILTLPFALATILSPIPFLFLIGLQTPVYTAGMIFLLLENNKILLDLHHSERNNRQMAPRPAHRSAQSRAEPEAFLRIARRPVPETRVAPRKTHRILPRSRWLQSCQ
jgi:hypothetical protein